MAIHPDHPELKVEIVVDDEALKEYARDEDEQDWKNITKYVQASSGAFFAVRYTIPKALFAEHGVRAVVGVDGVEMRRNPYNNDDS